MRRACRLGSPLGKAGLVDGHHGIRVSQVGQDIAAHFVTHAVLIPDGIGQEALHAIGAAFSGLFSQLPAIFACHITQDALQIQEAAMAWFRASKIGARRAWRDRNSAPQPITSWMVVFDPPGVLWCFCFTVFSFPVARSRVRFTPSACHRKQKIS